MVFELCICVLGLLFLLSFYGEVGLYVYIVLAILVANVQVLKIVQFSVYEPPIALGTAVFATTYLATDMLTEHYGVAAGRRSIFLGFIGFFLWTVLLMVTLGYQPLEEANTSRDMAWALSVQEHMVTIFLPTWRFFLAGMVAYFVSQLLDVWLFNKIRRYYKGRFLWLRNTGSTLISGLVDNTVFSLLAWVVLATDPMEWSVVLFTYILGTYGLRVMLAILDTPVMYVSRWCVKWRGCVDRRHEL